MESAYQCIDYLSEQILEIQTPNADRIPFMLSNADLTLLFALMYREKIISNEISIGKLGTIMENNFLYGKTKKLINTRKYLYDKYSELFPPPEKSIKILKTVFDKLFQ